MQCMAKTEVYSWRVEPTTKQALEEEARRQGLSLAELLDRIANSWLAARGAGLGDDEAEQARLRESLLATAGTLSGGDPERATRARSTLREKLTKKRGR